MDIKDMVRSAVHRAKKCWIIRPNPGPIREIINLGFDRSVPFKRVIAIIEELIGRRAKIIYKPKHSADVPTT